MRRILITSGVLVAFAGAAFADPAMTTVDTQMRKSPSAHAPIVQAIPAHAQIDVEGCGPVWCSASWRDIPGFVRVNAVVPGAGGPLHDAPGPGPGVVVAPPPVVVAPFGWGFYGWGHPWRHYYY